eukprot:TRINITY_DN2655_c0_g1_i1.p1 TRINITY_DN2655_c0_g1~~TRINITY_DN2655_c0_g1_i1.p1  ORF type:complete len:6405 (+),score=577.74 TRINITY_DN2655_c0_g1_i1:61-19275(+)
MPSRAVLAACYSLSALLHRSDAGLLQGVGGAGGGRCYRSTLARAAPTDGFVHVGTIIGDHRKNWIDHCINACNGYRFARVVRENQCWCGNEYDPQSYVEPVARSCNHCGWGSADCVAHRAGGSHASGDCIGLRIGPSASYHYKTVSTAHIPWYICPIRARCRPVPNADTKSNMRGCHTTDDRWFVISHTGTQLTFFPGTGSKGWDRDFYIDCCRLSTTPCYGMDCTQCVGTCTQPHASSGTRSRYGKPGLGAPGGAGYRTDTAYCGCQCSGNHIDASIFAHILPVPLGPSVPGKLDQSCSGVKGVQCRNADGTPFMFCSYCRTGFHPDRRISNSASNNWCKLADADPPFVMRPRAPDDPPPPPAFDVCMRKGTDGLCAPPSNHSLGASVETHDHARRVLGGGREPEPVVRALGAAHVEIEHVSDSKYVDTVYITGQHAAPAWCHPTVLGSPDDGSGLLYRPGQDLEKGKPRGPAMCTTERFWGRDDSAKDEWIGRGCNRVRAGVTASNIAHRTATLDVSFVADSLPPVGRAFMDSSAWKNCAPCDTDGTRLLTADYPECVANGTTNPRCTRRFWDPHHRFKGRVHVVDNLFEEHGETLECAGVWEEDVKYKPRGSTWRLLSSKHFCGAATASDGFDEGIKDPTWCQYSLDPPDPNITCNGDFACRSTTIADGQEACWILNSTDKVGLSSETQLCVIVDSSPPEVGSRDAGGLPTYRMPNGTALQRVAGALELSDTVPHGDSMASGKSRRFAGYLVWPVGGPHGFFASDQLAGDYIACPPGELCPLSDGVYLTTEQRRPVRGVFSHDGFDVVAAQRLSPSGVSVQQRTVDPHSGVRTAVAKVAEGDVSVDLSPEDAGGRLVNVASTWSGVIPASPGSGHALEIDTTNYAGVTGKMKWQLRVDSTEPEVAPKDGLLGRVAIGAVAANGEIHFGTERNGIYSSSGGAEHISQYVGAWGRQPHDIFLPRMSRIHVNYTGAFRDAEGSLCNNGVCRLWQYRVEVHKLLPVRDVVTTMEQADVHHYVRAVNHSEGAHVALSPCTASEHQASCRWVVEESATTPRHYHIRASAAETLFLSSAGGLVHLGSCNTTAHSQGCLWLFEPSPTRDAHWYIKAAGTGQYLHGASGNSSAGLALAPCPKHTTSATGDTPQCQWRLANWVIERQSAVQRSTEGCACHTCDPQTCPMYLARGYCPREGDNVCGEGCFSNPSGTKCIARPASSPTIWDSAPLPAAVQWAGPAGATAARPIIYGLPVRPWDSPLAFETEGYPSDCSAWEHNGHPSIVGAGNEWCRSVLDGPDGTEFRVVVVGCSFARQCAALSSVRAVVDDTIAEIIPLRSDEGCARVAPPSVSDLVDPPCTLYRFRWRMRDPHSGIAGVRWMLVQPHSRSTLKVVSGNHRHSDFNCTPADTLEGDCRLGWCDCIARISWAGSPGDPGLIPGESYEVMLLVTNGRGLVAHHRWDFVADTSAVRGGVVLDGTGGPDVDFTAHPQLCASWYGFQDPQSPITAVAVRWLLDHNATVVARIDVDPSQQSVCYNMSLVEAERYRAEVTATSSGGRVVKMSNGVVYAPSAPEPAGVDISPGGHVDGVRAPQVGELLRAEWEPFGTPVNVPVWNYTAVLVRTGLVRARYGDCVAVGGAPLASCRYTNISAEACLEACSASEKCIRAAIHGFTCDHYFTNGTDATAACHGVGTVNAIGGSGATEEGDCYAKAAIPGGPVSMYARQESSACSGNEVMESVSQGYQCGVKCSSISGRKLEEGDIVMFSLSGWGPPDTSGAVVDVHAGGQVDVSRTSGPTVRKWPARLVTRDGVPAVCLGGEGAGALCLTEPECRALCDSTPGCGGVAMHKTLPRCVLKTERCTRALASSAEWDFLRKQQAEHVVSGSEHSVLLPAAEFQGELFIAKVTGRSPVGLAATSLTLVRPDSSGPLCCQGPEWRSATRGASTQPTISTLDGTLRARNRTHLCIRVLGLYDAESGLTAQVDVRDSSGALLGSGPIQDERGGGGAGDRVLRSTLQGCVPIRPTHEGARFVTTVGARNRAGVPYPEFGGPLDRNGNVAPLVLDPSPPVVDAPVVPATAGGVLQPEQPGWVQIGVTCRDQGSGVASLQVSTRLAPADGAGNASTSRYATHVNVTCAAHVLDDVASPLRCLRRCGDSTALECDGNGPQTAAHLCAAPVECREACSSLPTCYGVAIHSTNRLCQLLGSGCAAQNRWEAAVDYHLEMKANLSAVLITDDSFAVSEGEVSRSITLSPPAYPFFVVVDCVDAAGHRAIAEAGPFSDGRQLRLGRPQVHGVDTDQGGSHAYFSTGAHVRVTADATHFPGDILTMRMGWNSNGSTAQPTWFYRGTPGPAILPRGLPACDWLVVTITVHGSSGTMVNATSDPFIFLLQPNVTVSLSNASSGTWDVTWAAQSCATLAGAKLQLREALPHAPGSAQGRLLGRAVLTSPSVSGVTEINASARPALSDGDRVVAVANFTDLAGQRVHVVSEPQMYDSSPPEGHLWWIGVATVTSQSDGLTLGYAIADTQSGLASLQVATHCGSCPERPIEWEGAVKQWPPTEGALQVSLGEAAQPGELYVVKVRAIGGAGAFAEFAISVTFSARPPRFLSFPTVGTAGTRSDFATSVIRFSVNATDADTGDYTARVALLTASGDVVVAARSVVLHEAAGIREGQLLVSDSAYHHGGRYKLNVTLTNAGGLSASAVSLEFTAHLMARENGTVEVEPCETVDGELACKCSGGLTGDWNVGTEQVRLSIVSATSGATTHWDVVQSNRAEGKPWRSFSVQGGAPAEDYPPAGRWRLCASPAGGITSSDTCSPDLRCAPDPSAGTLVVAPVWRCPSVLRFVWKSVSTGGLPALLAWRLDGGEWTGVDGGSVRESEAHRVQLANGSHTLQGKVTTVAGEATAEVVFEADLAPCSVSAVTPELPLIDSPQRGVHYYTNRTQALAMRVEAPPHATCRTMVSATPDPVGSGWTAVPCNEMVWVAVPREGSAAQHMNGAAVHVLAECSLFGHEHCTGDGFGDTASATHTVLADLHAPNVRRLFATSVRPENSGGRCGPELDGGPQFNRLLGWDEAGCPLRNENQCDPSKTETYNGAVCYTRYKTLEVTSVVDDGTGSGVAWVLLKAGDSIVNITGPGSVVRGELPLLTSGAHTVVDACAADWAGNVGCASHESSDASILRVVSDATPPRDLHVTVLQDCGDWANVEWTGAADISAGTATYLVSIGSAPGRSDWKEWNIVRGPPPVNLTEFATHRTREDGYVTVVVEDPAGNVAVGSALLEQRGPGPQLGNQSSSPTASPSSAAGTEFPGCITQQAAVPPVHVADGLGPTSADVAFLTQPGRVSCSWSVAGQGAPNATVQWGVGTYPGADDALPLRSATSSRSGSAQVQLQHGVRYYCVVRVTLGAAAKVFHSDGATADLAPFEPWASLGAPYQASRDVIAEYDCGAGGPSHMANTVVFIAASCPNESSIADTTTRGTCPSAGVQEQSGGMWEAVGSISGVWRHTASGDGPLCFAVCCASASGRGAVALARAVVDSAPPEVRNLRALVRDTDQAPPRGRSGGPLEDLPLFATLQGMRLQWEAGGNIAPVARCAVHFGAPPYPRLLLRGAEAAQTGGRETARAVDDPARPAVRAVFATDAGAEHPFHGMPCNAQQASFNERGAAADLPMGSAPYTIELSFRTTNIANATLIQWGTGLAGQVTGLRIERNGSALRLLGSRGKGNELSGEYENTSDTAYSGLADGEWHHIAATWNGTTRALYVDFVKIASDVPDDDRNAANTTDSFSVGCFGDTAARDSFNGTIRDVRVLNGARPPEASAPFTSTLPPTGGSPSGGGEVTTTLAPGTGGFTFDDAAFALDGSAVPDRKVTVDVVCTNMAEVASAPARIDVAVHSSRPSTGTVQHAREVRRPSSGGAAVAPLWWTGLEDNVLDVRHTIRGTLQNGTTIFNTTLAEGAAPPVDIRVPDLLATVNLTVVACNALGKCTAGYSRWPLAITEAGGDLSVGRFLPSLHCQTTETMRCVFSSLAAVRLSWSGFGPDSAMDRYEILFGSSIFSLAHRPGVQVFHVGESQLAVADEYPVRIVGIDRVGERTETLNGTCVVDPVPPGGGTVSGSVTHLKNDSMLVQCSWTLPDSTGGLRSTVLLGLADAVGGLAGLPKRLLAETNLLNASFVAPGPPRSDWRCKVTFVSMAGLTHSVFSSPLWRAPAPRIAVFDGANAGMPSSYTQNEHTLSFSWSSHGHPEEPESGSYVTIRNHLGWRCSAAAINATGDALQCKSKCGSSVVGKCAGNIVGLSDDAALCGTLAECRAACSRSSTCAGLNQHLTKPLCYMQTSACSTGLQHDAEWRFVPWADGGTPSTAVQPPAAQGSATAVVAGGLVEGGHYSVELTLCWSAARCETAESDGVTVDREPPQNGSITVAAMSGQYVLDCPQGTGQTCAASVAGKVLVQWRDFSDAGSGLARYEVEVKSPSGESLSDPVDAGLDTSIAVHVPRVFASHNDQFGYCHAEVTALDRAGNRHTEQSATALIESAPRAPPNASARTATTLGGVVTISWGQSNGVRVFDVPDMPSGLHAEVCLWGTASGSVAPTSCPCEQWERVTPTWGVDSWATATMRLDSIESGDHVLACVRGVSGVGLASAPVIAPALLFDATPPEVDAVHAPRWSTSSAIGFRFDGARDRESGIRRCDFAAHYSQSGDPVTEVLGCTASGSGLCEVHVPGNITVNLPGWKHGIDVLGRLTCWNNVGASASAEAATAWDDSPPQFQLSAAVAPHLCSDAPFRVSWPLCNSVSGTARFEVALEEAASVSGSGTSPTSLKWRAINDFEDVGLRTEHTFPNAIRSDGLLRYRVLCWSRAGLSAEWVSRPLDTLRARPVVPPVIADGPPTNRTHRPEDGVFIHGCVCTTCGETEEDGLVQRISGLALQHPGAQRRCARHCADTPGCVRTALSAAGCSLYGKGAALQEGSANRSCWVPVPECGQLPTRDCASGALRDVSAQVSTAEAHAHWAVPFWNLRTLDACLGRTSADCTVQEWTPQLLSATDITLYGLQLRDQHSYILRLRACSVCGHCTVVATDGFLVSSSRPATPAVHPGPRATGPTIRWTPPSEEAVMHWSGSAESIECAWAIGSTAGGVSVMDWSTIDCSGGEVNHRALLGEGLSVYHSVRVCNSMGLCSVGVSRPVRVSASAAVVEDVSVHQLGHDVSVVRMGWSWGARWWGFASLHPEVPIEKYVWEVDTHGTPTATASLPTETASGTSTRTVSLPTATVTSTLPTASATMSRTLPTASLTATTTATLPDATMTSTLSYTHSELVTGSATQSVTLPGATGTSTGTVSATLPEATAAPTLQSSQPNASGALTRPLSAASIGGSRRLLQEAPTPCHRTKHGVVCGAWEDAWDTICTGGEVHEEHVTLPEDCLLLLQPGSSYRVLVRAVFADDTVRAAVSNGVTIIDERPVSDGVFLPSLVTTFTGLRVTWGDFKTSEAPVVRYRVRLRTPQAEVIVDGGFPAAAAAEWIDVGLERSFVFSRPLLLASGSLAQVQNVQAEVEACNAAGFCGNGESDWVEVLATWPQPPEVWDGHEGDGYGKNNDQDITTDNTTLKFGFQPCVGSGQLRHDWCIGTSPGQCNVVGTWQFVNASTAPRSEKAGGLALEREQVYYVTVRCTNLIGLSTWAASDGVRFIVPQTGDIEEGCGSVYHGLVDRRHKPYQSDPGNFSAHWMDQQIAFGVAGAGEYYFTAELRNQYDVPVVLARKVGYAQHVQWSGLTLRHGDSYTVVVQLLSERGRCVSRSRAPTVLDTTRPEAPNISAPAVVTSRNDAKLTVVIPARDPESGIDAMQVAVGTTPYGTQVQLYQDVSTRIATIRVDADLLISGMLYWVVVLVRNGAGLTNASLVSFRTDWEPPSITVAASLHPSADGEGMLAVWQVVDDSQGPVNVTVELVGENAVFSQHGSPALPASGRRVFALPSTGSSFRVRITARDAHGNRGVKLSEMVMRASPPHCGNLFFRDNSVLRRVGSTVHSAVPDLSFYWDAAVGAGSTGIVQVDIRAEAGGQQYAGGLFSGAALCSDPYPLAAPESKVDTKLTVNGLSASGAWCPSPAQSTIVWHDDARITSLAVDTMGPCVESRFVRPGGAITVSWAVSGVSAVDSIIVRIGAAEDQGVVVANFSSPGVASWREEVLVPADLPHGASAWVTVRALTKAGTKRFQSARLQVDALLPDTTSMELAAPRLVYAASSATFTARLSGAFDIDSGVCGIKGAVAAADGDCSAALVNASVHTSMAVPLVAPHGHHRVCVAAVDRAGNIGAPLSAPIDVRTGPLPPPQAALVACRDGSIQFSLRRHGTDPTTLVPYNLSVTVDADLVALQEVSDFRAQVHLRLQQNLENRSSLQVAATPTALPGAPIPWRPLQRDVDISPLAHHSCVQRLI